MSSVSMAKGCAGGLDEEMLSFSSHLKSSVEELATFTVHVYHSFPKLLAGLVRPHHCCPVFVELSELRFLQRVFNTFMSIKPNEPGRKAIDSSSAIKDMLRPCHFDVRLLGS